MDNFDKRVLNYIQNEFPLDVEPFKILSQKLNLDETIILNRIKALKKNKKVIKNICGIFDGSMLGYQSALIAMSTSKTIMPLLVREINKFSGVSHNYERDHDYNIWFTLALQKNKDFNNEIISLAKKYDVERFLILPSVKTFKLMVSFKLIDNTDEPFSEMSIKPEKKNEYKIENSDREIIRLLQEDIPLTHRPFDSIAEKSAFNSNQIIERAQKYLSEGILRKFSATLKHQNIGYKFNAMIVWKIDSHHLDNVGQAFSANEFVSHCYERITYPEWPYNLYTMVHARSQEELNSYIKHLYDIASPESYEILKTLREFKKERVKYFND